MIKIKLPNRYGTVVKLSGNRRRPYAVKEGRSGQQKIIGYAATKEEGLKMLADYNYSPWDMDAKKVTFSELYNLWLEKRPSKIQDSSINNLKSAYKNHCCALYDMPYCEIRKYHMQECIDACEAVTSKKRIKNLLHHLDKYALELEIVDKTFSSLLEVATAPPKERSPFTPEEVDTLWENVSNLEVEAILVLLYTGYRSAELLGMKIENVDLEQGIMRGGVKTVAGKNRIVPIHSRIRPIIEKHYHESQSGYLFEKDGTALTKSSFLHYIWKPTMRTFSMDHTPHECRHTFRSRLDSAGANKVCIDLIMGHASPSVGERVYTHKTLDELRATVELMIH